MMRVIRDGIWLCVDCLMVAVNDDASGLDFSYAEEDAAAKLATIYRGLERLGPNLVPAEGHEEFATMGCDCCGSMLAGEMHEFAILGNVRTFRVPTVWQRTSRYSEAVRCHVRADSMLSNHSEGYPLFYVVDGHTCACAKCASSLHESGDTDEGKVTGADANWEDPSLFCELCGSRIESAYAEEDAERLAND